jgi:hypothetical protein
MLRSTPGIFPYAPLHALFLDPHLPEWLPEIELDNLHVGGATVDLKFERTGDGVSQHQVLDVRGKLRIVRHSDPWSLTTDSGESSGRDIKPSSPLKSHLTLDISAEAA